MVNRHAKPTGFIAIVSLLIIAGVALFFSMRMLLDGVTNASLSLNSIYYEKARFNANTCLEDTLLRINRADQFSSNMNYIFSTTDSCQTALTWQASQPVSAGISQRPVVLLVTGNSNGFRRQFQYTLRVTKYVVNNTDASVKSMNDIHFDSIQELTT